MPAIQFNRNSKKINIDFESGKSLLQILQENGVSLVAPCGGNGTCGKCKVRVKGQGMVTSCVTYPKGNEEIILPAERESKVLTEQHKNTVVLPFLPGNKINLVGYPLGIAIDIGTTSVAFYLLSLITGGVIQVKGRENSQSKYGADVISRISYCSNSNGLKTLQKELVNAINEQIVEFCEFQEVDTNSIVKVSLAGNATMLHILLGIDPTPIALAPFTPQFTDEKMIEPGSIGLQCNAHADVHVLPSISAFVGADIVAGLASLNPPTNVKKYLFVDVGTNGEMALITPDKIWCCATAAGPAFEGANISCGVGAYIGAISSYNATGFKTINNEKPIGICGAGLIDVVAHMVNHNIVSADGLLEDDFIVHHDDDPNQNIGITQQDIREVQLAKSAIAAGIISLLEVANLNLQSIDALYLAGGLGNYINIESAVKIGLFPKELLGKIVQIGNSSGTGVTLDVYSETFKNKVSKVIERSEIVELSTHENFELNFAMNMYF